MLAVPNNGIRFWCLKIQARRRKISASSVKRALVEAIENEKMFLRFVWQLLALMSIDWF